ncbi:MAG: hypothetical protein KF797_10740 [Flavobacteriales bacterium]|nr:hypothetical protein [Flavobacteriales bacterium]
MIRSVAVRCGSLRDLLCLFGVVIPVVLPAQETWHREQYMSENGLLQNRVHAMVSDRWGALLIGTEGGLVRFDGDHFTQLGIQAAEGMKPSRVLDILPTSEGPHIILDSGCRQYLYKDGRLLPITADAPARHYSSRFTGMIGPMVATVNALDPDSALTQKAGWPAVVRGVALVEGYWCLRRGAELLVYQDTVFVKTIPVPNGRSTHLFRDGDHLFVLSDDGGIFRVDVDQGRVRRVVPKGMPPAETRSGLLAWRLLWDPQAMRAAIIAANRMYLLRPTENGDTLTAEQIPVELPDGAKIGPLVWLDGEDAFAMGTDTKGLFIFRRQRMRSVLCEGLSEGFNNAYNAQAPFGMGAVMASTRSGARLFDPSGCLQEPPPIRAFGEGAILLDRQDRYWYGRGDTLFIYDKAAAMERVMNLGARPLCFLEDGDLVWVGTANGILRAEGGRIQMTHSLADEDLSARPVDLCRTPAGELWMATCMGVFRLDADGGRSPVKGLERICARALEVIGDNVYVGSYGRGGFVVPQDGTVVQLRKDPQAFLTNVHAFMPDEAGFLWMSTNQGLFRVRLADMEAWVRDTTQAVYYAYYGKRAGISNAEFNGGCSPAYVRTFDGWASFPTMDGLVWFRPEQIPDAYPRSGIHLESLTVNGEQQDSSGVSLMWDRHELVLGISVAYWGDPENVRLEYGFEGNGWTSMASGQRELRFAGIPAGHHVLRIRKVGAPFRGDTAELRLAVHVPTPLHRRPWFILAMLCAVGLLFWGALQLNASRLRRRNLQLEGKVADRTRELVEANSDLRRSLEMKEMLVSIISHDIVTPLRFIARVAGGASRRLSDGAEARLALTLADLANSSEKLHANAQGLLQWIKRQDGRIELRPRNIVVHLLVEEIMDRERERAAEHAVALNNLVALDDTIRTDRDVLSIILHNAIGNAVTHSGKAAVTVLGERIGSDYRLVIKDTGVGMTEAVLRHARRVQAQGALGAMGPEGEREVQGLGLLIIADLTELMGGAIAVDSEPGHGTTMSITLPADSAVDAHAPGQRSVG